MQSGGLEHGLRPVRAAGLQPAAASNSHDHFPKTAEYNSAWRTDYQSVFLKRKGRTPRSVRPLSTPHSTETLEIAILG